MKTKEECRIYAKQYRETHKAQAEKSRKAYYQSHKEECRAYSKKHYEANREAVCLYNRERRKRLKVDNFFKVFVDVKYGVQMYKKLPRSFIKYFNNYHLVQSAGQVVV